MKPSPRKQDLAPMDGASSRDFLELEAFLPYRLNVIATEVSQNLARAYGERFGITIPEWRVLATIGQFGTMNARDIGAHSRMHKTTVSRAVAALEKRRLVVRRANRADLREAFLALTESGLSVYRQIVPMARAFCAELCDGFSAEELELFDRLLDRLVQRIGVLGGANPPEA